MWQCSSHENYYTSGRSTELKLCRLIGGETGKLINLGFPQSKTIIMPLIFQSPVPLFLCLLFSALPSLCTLSDVLSAPRFLVVVFSFVARTEFKSALLLQSFGGKSSPARISSHLRLRLRDIRMRNFS